MNVKRIVVDRIPHSCSNCQYVRYHQYNISGEVFPYACGANRISKQIEGGVELYRPEWCPLEVEDVCEWVGEYRGYDGHGDLIFVSKKTGCSDYHIQKVEVPNNTYCPNCGKRIKYVESDE
jgi:hypothetical protein